MDSDPGSSSGWEIVAVFVGVILLIGGAFAFAYSQPVIGLICFAAVFGGWYYYHRKHQAKEDELDSQR